MDNNSVNCCKVNGTRYVTHAAVNRAYRMHSLLAIVYFADMFCHCAEKKGNNCGLRLTSIAIINKTSTALIVRLVRLG